MEESAKDNLKQDNLKQEKSLHDMVPPCFWDCMDVFAKKSFVMITEDFETHLAAGRWRSKVLRL